MNNITNPSELVHNLKLSISSKSFHTNPQDCALKLSKLQSLFSDSSQKEFTKRYQKEMHAIIIGCISQIFNLKDPLKSQPYIIVLRMIIKELRLAMRSEYIVKQMLPLICATMWIGDKILLSISVNIIRLSIRYHPKVSSEIVLKPLIDAADCTNHEELLDLLLYIHSFYPICFRSHHYGKALLSTFIKPYIELPVQMRCLTLLHRILDDLPITETATKASFGSVEDCFEILLSNVSAENGAVLSSLLVKMAKRNLLEAMRSYANGELPNKLRIEWPGCLEAALSLLVAFAHECYRTGRSHLQSNQQRHMVPNKCCCKSACLEAIFKYLEESTRAKHVISCLVALQDIAPIVENSLLESHRGILEQACRRVGINHKALSEVIWIKNAVISSPYRNLAKQIDFREWLHNECEFLQTSRDNSKDSNSMPIVCDTDSPSASSSSSSLTTISSRSSRKVSISVTENGEESASLTISPNNCDCTSHNKDSSSSTGLYDNRKEPETNSTESSDYSKQLTSDDSSNTSTEISFKRSVKDRTTNATRSLPRQYENTVHRTPVSNIPAFKLGSNRQRFPKGCETRTEVRRVSSVKYASHESEANRRLRTVRRSQSSYRPSQHPPLEQSPVVRTDSIGQSLPANSAPHLSPWDQHDPIQRFHLRYYDKLLQYVTSVKNHFPFPIAASYSTLKESRTTDRLETNDFVVWLGNDYDRPVLQRTKSIDSKSASKSVSRSKKRDLYLYFACPVSFCQCMYPGTSLTRCFRVKTKYPLIWLQLLILWNQSKHGTAIPSDHPTMVPLRKLWAYIVNKPAEFQYGRQSRTTDLNDQSQKSANPRPLSACEATHQSWLMLNQQKSPVTNRFQVWNSTRIRSKSSLGKVSSFFLLATRAYPNQKDCERLVRELQEARFFESFVVHQRQTVEESRTIRSNHSEYQRKNNNERLHDWGCISCKYTGSTSQMPFPSCANGAPLAQRETDCETWFHDSNNLSLSIYPEKCIPYMTGILKSRHLKNIPKALSWLSSWQLNEFILRDSLFGWRRWKPPKATVHREESITNQSNGNLRFESYNQTKDVKLMAGDNDASMNYDKQTKGSNGRVTKNLESVRQWTALHVSSIRTVQCTRKSQTGKLMELIIQTDKHGVLLLRSSRPLEPATNLSAGDNNRDSPTIRPPITYAQNDELTLWMHCLQAAMNRSKQSTLPRGEI